jgi:hypothetical protein
MTDGTWCSFRASGCAADALPHRHPVLGGGRHRYCGCPERGGGPRKTTSPSPWPVSSEQSITLRLETVAMLLLVIAAVVLSQARNVRPSV